jgi:hypothetical protein
MFGSRKLEAREMLENGGESPPSYAPEKMDGHHFRGEKPPIFTGYFTPSWFVL